MQLRASCAVWKEEMPMSNNEDELSGSYLDGAVFMRRAMGKVHRAAMVRLVTAQQWAVAMSVLTSVRMIDLETGERFLSWCIWHPLRGARRHDIEALADLPCAVDVVNDLMGWSDG